MIKVTIWNEYLHEKTNDIVHEIYPEGIHNYIKSFVQADDIMVRTSVLEMPECGLTEEILENTDVLIWWGHAAHDKVPDAIAERVKQHVLNGMGFIPLHSSHYCKPLKMLLGTTMSLKWNTNDSEKLICISPFHPIASGVNELIELPHEEMYGEYFDIPKPDEVIFEGWFASGNVFRSGCLFNRGYGKIFYFQPGHETYPIYHNEMIQKIINNAIRYVAPTNRLDAPYTAKHCGK